MHKRIAQLDALRGVAILLVIFHNQSPKFPSLHLEPVFANGWMGVDLFFVLSGFLITGLLVDSKSSSHYLTNFYARRCLRIWPLYYSLLVFMFVVVPLLRPALAGEVFAPRSSPWWSYPLFLQNFLVPVPTSATGPLAVTWSLAIEEQFYLVWPIVVRHCTPGQLGRIALLVVVLSPLLRLLLSFYGVNLYSNPFCRLDGLMIGAGLAVLIRSSAFNPRPWLLGAWVTLAVALPLAFLLETLHARWIEYSFVALAAAAVVYLSLFSGQRWLQRITSNRFLTYTGTISYGLYLLHKIPFDAAEALHLQWHPVVMMAVGILGAYAMAAVSWHVLERPFLNLKRRFTSDRERGLDDGRFILARG